MVTAVFEDLLIPAGEVRTYTQNADSGISGALMFSPPAVGSPVNPSLTNHGEMRFLPDARPDGTQWFMRFEQYSPANDATISNYGVMSAILPTADYIRLIYAPSWSPNLATNAGTMAVEARREAIVYFSFNAYLSLENLAGGLMSAKAGESAITLLLANSPTIDNAGEIVANSSGGSAVAMSLPHGGTVTNSGLIHATDNNPTTPYAIAITSDYATVINSGTIRGDVAIRSSGVVQNTGLIEGLLILVGGTNQVLNAGQIVGDVDFGSERDFYDGRLGTIVGTVFGGEDSDLLLGGAGRDALDGGSGADALFARGGDTLTGGGGGDLFVFTEVVPGAAAEAITDFVSGTDRIDLRFLAPSSVTISGSTISAVTAAGTLTIQVSGTVALADILSNPAVNPTGTAGHDMLVAGPGGAVLSGGGGADFLVGGTGNDRLDGGAGWRDINGNDSGDLMRGGAGDDTYVVEFYDAVVEELDGGYDTVEFTPLVGRYVLPDNVERVIGMDEGASPFLNVMVDGNALDNVMIGSSRSDEFNGGAGNDTLAGGASGDALNGAAGFDFVDYRTSGAAVTVSLAGGTASGGDAQDDAIASIEGIYGSAFNDVLSGDGLTNTLYGGAGNDQLSAGAGNDRLDGGAGNDILDGGAGIDILIGGAGDDWYYVDTLLDSVTEVAGGGSNDRILASLNYTLGAGLQVERLTTSNDAALASINLTGNALANFVQGNAGANVLDGKLGADTLAGLAGNDIYYVDNAGDAVVESSGNGSDYVFSSVSYALGAGVHVERMATTSTAGTAAINLTGNEIANIIYGNAGNNILNGRGGADLMAGQGGNDSYYVDHAGDAISEAAGGGTDYLFSSVSYKLGAGAHVERMATTDSAGVAAINLTGNELANGIYGNAGSNSLNGGGGVDLLVGMSGDDFYYVDNAGDVIVEGSANGSDYVFGSVSYRLGAGVHVERMATTSTAGTAAINLTGNEIANIIYGNAGSNSLNGGGGADLLAGQGGDDFYYVDNAGDAIVETSGNGSDYVFSSTSYALGAGVHVERMATTSEAGTTAINLTGNELANIIYGNAGSNVLDGRGGSDTLVGRGGADTFRFGTALGAGNVDTVIGYTVADDTIALDDAAFAGLAPGALAAGAFVIGTAAADAGDRIIYNSASGALLFDADGIGALAAVQFALLSPGLAIAAGEFLVV